MVFFFKVQKGTVTAVSREVVRTYIILKEKYPDKADSEISHLIWDRWLPINRERLWTDESESRFMRFEEICDKRINKSDKDNIYTAFFDILYIETGICPIESTRYKDAAKMLFEDAKKLGYDFKNELKSELKKAKQLREARKRVETSRGKRFK